MSNLKTRIYILFIRSFITLHKNRIRSNFKVFFLILKKSLTETYFGHFIYLFI